MLVAFSLAPSGTPVQTGDAVHAGSSADGSGADAYVQNGSVHLAVAAAVKVVRESGLPNHTDSMFTTVEGDWDEVMDVVKRASEAVGRFGSRVSLVLKADIRPGHTNELTGKVNRLEKALGESR
ncbi:thiamine-binding protein [Paeniglutamicibacter antarcticus]|uniref:Thiamine-binding protein n=1 Tax=Arthrobacter terrae TaxID=2935737 RepID=A0A931G5U1_9MICC|nr:thiamine-binding protein [Arthrobacter terrae]MBG0739930.1 thiamine-binding protein [Arthrobacter terrae]